MNHPELQRSSTKIRLRRMTRVHQTLTLRTLSSSTLECCLLLGLCAYIASRSEVWKVPHLTSKQLEHGHGAGGPGESVYSIWDDVLVDGSPADIELGCQVTESVAIRSWSLIRHSIERCVFILKRRARPHHRQTISPSSTQTALAAKSPAVPREHARTVQTLLIAVRTVKS